MKKDNNEEEKSSGVSLEDYVIQDKINAFIQHYKPAKDESTCDEVYTDAKLRQFFKAWPCTLGDPLSIYTSTLRESGFIMKVSLSGEPAYFVCLKEN